MNWEMFTEYSEGKRNREMVEEYRKGKWIKKVKKNQGRRYE